MDYNLLQGINEGLPEEKLNLMKREGILTIKLLNENCPLFKYTFVIFLRKIFFMQMSRAYSGEILRTALLRKGSWKGSKNTATGLLTSRARMSME